MKHPIRLCVKCGALLKCQEILAAGPFPCPICHTQLQAPSSYGRWLGLGSLLLAVAGFLCLGFTSLRLVWAVLLSWFPIDYLALQFVKYVVPPRIEIALGRRPLRQAVREIMGPAELNLRNKKRP